MYSRIPRIYSTKSCQNYITFILIFFSLEYYSWIIREKKTANSTVIRKYSWYLTNTNTSNNNSVIRSYFLDFLGYSFVVFTGFRGNSSISITYITYYALYISEIIVKKNLTYYLFWLLMREMWELGDVYFESLVLGWLCWQAGFKAQRRLKGKLRALVHSTIRRIEEDAIEKVPKLTKVSVTQPPSKVTEN